MVFANKKLLESLIFFLVLVSFIVFGYCVYQSYFDKKQNNDEIIKVDNYYNPEFLFNNDYIKVANTIDDFNQDSDEVYMYLDKANTLYLKYINGNNSYNETISNLPKGKVSVFYNNLYDNFYELVAISSDKKLYYVAFDLDKDLKNNDEIDFVEVSGLVKDVYIPSYDKNGVYVNDKKNFKTNFIFSDENNNLKYLNYNDNKYYLEDDLEKVRPYFDYICASQNASFCKNIIIYQGFDNKLIYGFDDKLVKNEENEDIVVKNMFSTFEIFTDDKIFFEKVSYDKINKLYDYMFTVYILDRDDNFYKLELDRDSIIGKLDSRALTASSKKVKQFVINEKDGGYEASIIYYDGKREKIVEGVNKNIITSTSYERNKNKLIENN